MLVGSVFVRDGALHNGVALLDGAGSWPRASYELPNYGTFDEKRLFLPGPLPEPVAFRGAMLGLPICEDIWHPDVCRHLAQLGAEIFVCVNGSPYEIDKDVLRIDGVAKRRAIDTGIPLAYVNRVGGQDEVVFDGASFVVGPEGAVGATAGMGRGRGRHGVDQGAFGQRPPLALRGGRRGRAGRTPRRHLLRHGRGTARLCEQEPLSRRDPGPFGRDRSALCAAIAVDALGADRVWCVMLPSRYTSQESLDDAAGCAQMLGVRLDTVPIGPAVDGFTGCWRRSRARAGPDGREPAIAHSRHHLDGPVEQVRADAGDDRQQERDEWATPRSMAT
jgi:NAD+ synthase